MKKIPQKFYNPLITQNKRGFPWIVGNGDQTSKHGGQDYVFSFVYQMDSRGQVQFSNFTYGETESWVLFKNFYISASD